MNSRVPQSATGTRGPIRSYSLDDGTSQPHGVSRWRFSRTLGESVPQAKQDPKDQWCRLRALTPIALWRVTPYSLSDRAQIHMRCCGGVHSMANVGEVVLSLLTVADFRRERNDTPNPAGDYQWYECDGVQNLRNTPLGNYLGSSLTNVPDFRGRYPRGGWYGAGETDPRLPSGKGGVGTTVEDAIRAHHHHYRIPKHKVGGGDTETALVHNPQPEPWYFDDDTRDAGDTETRPASIVVRYYIKVR
jgi:hypothetical protein